MKTVHALAAGLIILMSMTPFQAVTSIAPAAEVPAIGVPAPSSPDVILPPEHRHRQRNIQRQRSQELHLDRWNDDNYTRHRVGHKSRKTHKEALEKGESVVIEVTTKEIGDKVRVYVYDPHGQLLAAEDKGESQYVYCLACHESGEYKVVVANGNKIPSSVRYSYGVLK